MSAATSNTSVMSQTTGNKLLIGAVIFFIIFIVIGITVTAIASARNNSPPVTMTPGSGNALSAARAARAAAMATPLTTYIK